MTDHINHADTQADSHNGSTPQPAQDDVEELYIATSTPQEAAKKTRKAWPAWLYAILFFVIDFAALAILQEGVTQSSTRVELSSTLDGLGTMISKVGQGNFVLFLNMLLIGLVYVALLMLTNRFWASSAVLLIAATIIAAVEKLKISARYEALLPSDLNLFKGNAGNIMEFMPDGAGLTIGIAAAVIVVVIVLAVLCSHFDGRHGSLIRLHNKPLGAVLRIIFVIVPLCVLGGYSMSVGTVDSWGYKVSRGMGDIPSMWDSVYDAQRNGPLASFLRQLNPKIMEEPANYSEATMQALASKYAGVAESINESRNHALTDSTVVYVLSESFSDPTRVPGVELNKDPMPFIRELKGETTSGLMLSSGYGGGTANLEYMGLTGLSMANFDSSLTSPYQQILPSAHWVTSINQLWGPPEYSIGLHPYEPNMYSRESNYKKLGFSHFYALEGDDIISHQDRIDDSPYVSDEATYKSTIEELKKTDDNQFLQVITMQNHMPYNDWYENNEFESSAAEGTTLTDKERKSINTYAKGMELTDEATKEFLEQIDEIDKPITVVFYGDHLPGIYSTAGADSKNSLALHLTDYFIWSNAASEKIVQDAPEMKSNVYSSPNFFIAQAATQMNAKVSPYIAFLTKMHEKVAAMEPPVVNTIQGWDRIPEGQAIYLNSKGEPMSQDDMDAATKELLEDYKLIQYDITAGNNYLRSTDFMTLPN